MVYLDPVYLSVNGSVEKSLLLATFVQEKKALWAIPSQKLGNQALIL